MTPKYYCENCGREVKPGAATCPACGSRFTAVRCPQCGYEGRENQFRTGCPACGYMVEPAPASPQRSAKSARFLPAWFYRVAAFALLAAVVVLLVVLLVRA